MYSWLTRTKEPRVRRAVEVGWLVDAKAAGFIYGAPRALGRDHPRPAHPKAVDPKAVDRCPAIADHEARLFEIACPVDLHLRLARGAAGEFQLVNAAGAGGTLSGKALRSLVSLMAPERWRDPRRPVIQVLAPWRFVADQPVYMTQMPPFGHYRSSAWPGLLIGGRFPIHIWPRSLQWAFEWWDASKDLVLKLGEPWFYLRFETQDPARPVRLVEAEMTPQLRAHCNGLDGVTSYVSQTLRLFETAAARRPRTLVKKRRSRLAG